MNAHQLKQFIENNAWYGENRRIADADRPLISDALIQPDYTKIWGIDISPWDGVVNLGKTKSLGCAFVFIKGIDGTINSRYFPENYRTAVEAGLPRSSYAWLYANRNVSCVAQAQAFTALMDKYPPSAGLPPVIDFESTRYSGVQSNPDFSDLRRWATEWLRLGNQKPLLYSAKYYMDQFLTIPSDLKDMFAGLWIANYGVQQPNLPLGWNMWKFWQFAANGDALLLAPGNTNKQELDLNYSALQAEPEPPTGGTMEYGRVKMFTNIRSSPPGGTYEDIGDLHAGDNVTASEIRMVNNYPWWHLVSASRNGSPLDLPGPECWAYGVNIEKVAAPVPPAETLSVTVDVVVNVEGYAPKTLQVHGELEKI